ncbi:integrase [Psychromonas sp. CNPT3]|uniref:tyrosine-type recombinase/integrase n=1 Tax=Psychromonas sp. CNPT3 TaxID=314282 RepID=UPI00006E3C1C|nr:tyrosine-type recombinase/integrase [Psychromonas sp. CNPT3]AGH81593.1 integrase [Psychromonas sp. CNPT3]
MAKLSVRKPTNNLYFDFIHQGMRYREQTELLDSKANRRLLQKKLDILNAELITGTFDYVNSFPESKIARRLSKESLEAEAIQSSAYLFKNFIVEWIEENKLHWRDSHLVNIQSMINKYYLPIFGETRVDRITRAELLKFRTSLSKVPGRNGRISLSNNRINKIMNPLRRIFEEAADRYDFNTPFVRIKILKIPKSDVLPFSLKEVSYILENVRPDYQTYYLTRFFTGMRTGEIDGLKWKFVDFELRIIKIRETVVAGEESYTKTDASQRDISMSQPVYDALVQQYKITNNMSKFVFCNKKGECIEHNNVTKRVWYPLLKYLKLEKRRPYQTRHTAATLWLASGESPEWIARQMGHSNTEMLFKVYSRYVPNLTRQDGSAMEKLLRQGLECSL